MQNILNLACQEDWLGDEAEGENQPLALNPGWHLQLPTVTYQFDRIMAGNAGTFLGNQQLARRLMGFGSFLYQERRSQVAQYGRPNMGEVDSG